jgi:hypothetical protein
MRLLITVLFFLARPFWETKPPEEWSPKEIEMMRTESPWAESIGPSPALLVYLATAAPIEDAEMETRVRLKAEIPNPDPDYLDYVRQKRGEYFVLAVPYQSFAAFSKPVEVTRMEEESSMAIGKKHFRIAGHFPPTAADPVLRLVFPREIEPTDKQVVFRLYLPGVEFPDREATFRVKDLMYRGKLEM